MKHIYFTLFIALFTVAQAQEVEDSVSMQPNYTNDVFYSLRNGEVSQVSASAWTVAFFNKQQSAAIMINSGRGVQLWNASDDVNDFATITDTVGLSTWTELHDQDTTWDAYSAFEDASTGGQFNYGWGNYNMNTHQVEGSRVFMIKTVDGNYYKVLVEDKVSGVFHFRYASLDNTLDTTFTIPVSDYLNKNYAYLNMDNNSLLDREPSNASYDFLFTKYATLIPYPTPTYYPVTGAISNVGTQVALVHNLPENSSHIGVTFSGHKNAIGSEWKSFNNTTFTYEIPDSMTYFIKTNQNDIYRLYFTKFEGGSTGNIAFKKELLVDGSVGIRENNAPFLIETLYPNPSKGNVTIAFSSEVSKNIQLNVYSVIGKLIYQQNIAVNSGLNAFNIPLNNQENGVYLVQLSDGKNTTTQKLILSK